MLLSFLAIIYIYLVKKLIALSHEVHCSGQRCTAVKIVLAMESIADKLVEKVNAKVNKLTVGPPEADSDVTPVINEASANFIEELAIDAQQKGAKLCQVK